MTKQTWTAGPWRNRQTRNGSWRIEGPRLASSARKLIPIVLADILKHSQLPADEPAANARLIALAPEMAAFIDCIAALDTQDYEAVCEAKTKAKQIAAKLKG